MQVKYSLIGLGIALLIGVGGYYAVYHSKAQPTTKDVDLGNGIIAKDVPAGVTVSLATTTTNVKPPALDGPINFRNTFTADVVTLYKNKITATRAEIKKGGNQFQNWMLLGALYQEIGDINSALEVFNYLSAISPKNTVSFNNAGQLYQYYLKDYPKAETNFKTAIQNDPKYVISYENLFDLYRLSYKTNTSAAVDTLKLGLKNNPDDKDLQMLLDKYQSGQLK
jgi:tetratricopeptide (TPR) repeat protein